MEEGRAGSSVGWSIVFRVGSVLLIGTALVPLVAAAFSKTRIGQMIIARQEYTGLRDKRFGR